MSKGMFGFTGKSIEKGVISVGKGTIGIMAGDFAQHKILPKIPHLGEHFEDKPLLTHGVLGAVGILMMGSDFMYDAGLCLAANQVAKGIYCVDHVRKFMGYNDPVLSGVSKMIAAEINKGIADEIAKYKADHPAVSDGAELSDETVGQAIASVD